MTNPTSTPPASADASELMIEQTRENLKRHAFSYIIWGWAVVMASVGHYFLLGFDQFPFNASTIWPAAIILGALISVSISLQQTTSPRRPTYIESSLSGQWKGFAGPVIIALMLGTTYGWGIAFPVLIAAFGWGVINSGILLRFRPLIYGGISTFVFAVLAMYVSEQTALLMLTLSVSTGFLVPAYLLKYSPTQD